MKTLEALSIFSKVAGIINSELANSTSPFPKYIKLGSYPINNKRGHAAKQKREAKKAKRK